LKTHMNGKFSLKWVLFGWLVLLLMTADVCIAATKTETVLSLDNCLKSAFQNSEKRKAATLNVDKAEYRLKQAEAGMLPNLTYNVYTQESDSLSQDGNSGGLMLSQSLYTGGKLQAGIKQAKLELANARENERQVKQRLIYEVKTAFYQLWLANQKLEVARAAHANMKRHFNNTEKKFQEGMISHFELLQAEVNWKKLRPTVIAAQNKVALSRLNLGMLIGIESNNVFNITAERMENIVPEKPGFTLEKGLETAYRDHPEMRQQQNSQEIAKQGIKIAKAEYYPIVTVSGSYQATTEGSSTDWNKVWALKLNLSGTLFNGFETKAKVAAAEVDVKMQESNVLQLRDAIRLALESGLQSLEESMETIMVTRVNIDLMQNALQLTQLKLEEGMATTTNLMDAQLDLDRTLNDYYSGICDYLTAQANLDLTLGKDY
jgi:outer membrane protein